MCGFFFYPASMMLRLIEVIEAADLGGDDAGGHELRAGPAGGGTHGEVPGFVVSRILTAAMSEVWKATEEEELSIEDVDQVIKDSGANAVGPNA